MDAEALLVTAVLVAATLPFVVLALRARTLAVRTGVFALWALCASLVAWAAAEYPPPARPPVTDRPIQVEADGYVSSNACQACHPEQYASWHASYHRTMTQAADADTVLCPIDGTAVQARGGPYVLERRGREVWVELQDPDWSGIGEAERVWRRIVQTTGSHNKQLYWIASGHTRRLSLLPIMYRLLDERRWGPLDACCLSSQDIVQESGTGRWNRVCNRCHATHGMPRIRSEDEMDTEVAELGIACEACHGPGGEHAERNRDPLRRYASHLSGAADEAIVDPSELPKERSSQVCGQCHGIHVFPDDAARDAWRENGFRYQPGDDLEAQRVLKKDGADKFWSDGMVRVSGREYNGLVDSPCYQNGDMTCLSCHVLHPSPDDPRPLREWADDQLKPGMDGDLACTQCHAGLDREEHTHHRAGSTGAACMNCHMPYTTYGLLKGIRSHQVSSPSVQESLATGRPNACSQCHLDRPLAWAAERLEAWYAIPAPELGNDERNVAAGVLWTLKGDAGQRALMAWSLGWDAAREASGTDWITPYLGILMRDSYRAVRYIAQRSLGLQPEAPQAAGYDFTGDAATLERGVLPVYNAWLHEAPGRKRSDALLIDAAGGLDMAAFERLLSERDEHPVILNE
jgi:Cytochrome c552/Cytochrome c554 and c-prime